MKETGANLQVVVIWSVCICMWWQGVLDLLANRCLASGTNAWTDTDHTCYTMTTAGSVGFLNLLPVYLDHILYPLLTVWPVIHHSLSAISLSGWLDYKWFYGFFIRFDHLTSIVRTAFKRLQSNQWNFSNGTIMETEIIDPTLTEMETVLIF